ncbi:hypothetical protein ACFYWP_41190 [Actinacidiphila glaucinigra]|uniref:hypothetical protein n=1 Tax=Actinacidiphila glaucinigra TaxID=235986 RepID=UPI0036B97A59
MALHVCAGEAVTVAAGALVDAADWNLLPQAVHADAARVATPWDCLTCVVSPKPLRQRSCRIHLWRRDDPHAAGDHAVGKVDKHAAPVAGTGFDPSADTRHLFDGTGENYVDGGVVRRREEVFEGVHGLINA